MVQISVYRSFDFLKNLVILSVLQSAANLSIFMLAGGKHTYANTKRSRRIFAPIIVRY